MSIGALGLIATPLLSQGYPQRPKNPDYPGGYGNSAFFNRISATATVGSGWVNGNFDQFGEIGLGEVSVSYAITRQLDLGLSTSGSMLCNQAYRDESGAIISSTEDPLAEECTEAWTIGQSFSLFARYFPLSELPAFAQANAGYSLDGEAPFLGLVLGWGQPVYDRMSVIGQFRYATLLGSDIDFVKDPGGFRLELGIGWNL